MNRDFWNIFPVSSDRYIRADSGRNCSVSYWERVLPSSPENNSVNIIELDYSPFCVQAKVTKNKGGPINLVTFAVTQNSE